LCVRLDAGDSGRDAGDDVRFVVGQRVRCVDGQGSPFTVGAVYTVYAVSVSDGAVALEEVRSVGAFFDPTRFVPDARPVQYTAKVDAALDASCRDFTKRDWLELAMASLDQAGLSADAQDGLRRTLQDALDLSENA
jgi:hypothetical protein